jgi:uncharacterized protein (DUF983 family)
MIDQAIKTQRDTFQAMLRGCMSRCPNCGKGRLYGRFLKVIDNCGVCGEELMHHRADDAPPYFTITIVGHIILVLALGVEKAFAPAVWVHVALWLPLTLGMSLALLPSVKGAIVGLQWAWRMHGFGGAHHTSDA